MLSMGALPASAYINSPETLSFKIDALSGIGAPDSWKASPLKDEFGLTFGFPKKRLRRREGTGLSK